MTSGLARTLAYDAATRLGGTGRPVIGAIFALPIVVVAPLHLG
jgi:hypothetical protein